MPISRMLNIVWQLSIIPSIPSLFSAFPILNSALYIATGELHSYKCSTTARKLPAWLHYVAKLFTVVSV